MTPRPISLAVSNAWRIERASVVVPVEADPDDVSTFVGEVLRAALDAGRAGGPAVAEGVMTAPRLEAPDELRALQRS